MFLHICAYYTQRYSLCLLVIAQDSSTVHDSILSSRLFTRKVKITPPNRHQRMDIFEKMVLKHSHSLNGIDFQLLSCQSEGFRPLDIQNITSRAIYEMLKTQSKELTTQHFTCALKDYIPYSNRHLTKNTASLSMVSWEDIGGLENVKETIRKTIEWPTKYSMIFSCFPLKPRSGYI